MKPENILKKYAPEIFLKSGVVTIGLGTKWIGGVDTGKPALVIGVKEKLSLSILAVEDIVPPKIKGLLTDVTTVGEVTLMEDRLAKWRPAPGGVSVGHYKISAGTLGAWVKKDGEYVILSNNHVLANLNDCKIGDAILQPGVYDGGIPNDQLAVLTQYIPLNIKGSITPQLDVVVPNGGEVWSVGDTKAIQWESNLEEGLVRIEITRDGINWYTLNYGVDITLKKFAWKVTAPETDKALIKVVLTTSPYTEDASDNYFSIKNPPPSTCKISNTAASTFNLMATVLGRKTRLIAIVPISEEATNLVDCAIAKPLKGEDVLPIILELGNIEGIAEPEVGMKVKKSGRTTGVTYGEITQTDVQIKVEMGNNRTAIFSDQFIALEKMCKPGDSGSIILTEDNRAVGLLFAGSNYITVGNRFSNVVNALGIET